MRRSFSRRSLVERAAVVAGAAASTSGLLAATGCVSPNVTATLLPPPLPRDRAAVFRTAMPGERVIPLGVPESPWHVMVEAPATVSVGVEGVRLVSLPGRRVWASPRLPLAPAAPVAPGQIEELSWQASVTIPSDLRFFILCELRFAGEPGAVLVQPTPFDLQVMHDADRPGGGTSSSISRLVGDGAFHSWRVRLDEQRTELRLNGTPVWTMDGHRALSSVAFGETRTDPLHGGTMLLREVVYVRRPILPDEKGYLE